MTDSPSHPHDAAAIPDAPHPGAFVFRRAFFDADEIVHAARLAQGLAAQKRNVHATGLYADLPWYQVDLDPALPMCAKLLAALGGPTANLLVFYYLEPGAAIHPHRDLTGAGLNNRIRFHLPIITNAGLDFRVSGRRIRMLPGDLWCLDTSYRHSVRNGGAASRVHIVLECEITPAIAEQLPRSAATALHNIWFAAVLCAQFVRAVATNAIMKPRHFRDQLTMIVRFVHWRFLKQGDPR